ncbi:TetR family transcriptional regulator [Haloechinothrix sp. YIM 98757]|uniref:TetR family transcriptional regulator n=1 Tax=Haloechinothrix aidingensis TaxID=2752311 RepID=A0A838AB34_9PSEU|nr:TetR family transcriptional regulator [Haloechinothrix aidingensis]
MNDRTSPAPDPPVEGLRARKKRATRELLERVTLRLAVEHGFDHVTAEGIAEAAEVSTRTFFNYFASKEDAAFGHAKTDSGAEEPERVVELVREQPPEAPPLRALRVAVTAFVGELTADKELSRLRCDLVRTHPRLGMRLMDRVVERERQLTSVLAERTGLDPIGDAYPSVVVAASTAAARSAMVRWMASDSAAQPVTFVEEAFDVLERGFVPAK